MEQVNSKSPQSPKTGDDKLHKAICRRAEEIYIRNGKVPGHDIQNWMQAEQEILRESACNSAGRAAVVINVNGIPYVGEYLLESAEGYTPGEFSAGDRIPIRFEDNQMFIQRPDGRELRTTLVGQAS